jgi:hypothetical protein
MLMLVPILVVGVVAGLSAIAAHQGDAAFVFYQEHPRTVQPRQLELVVQKSHEPLPEGPGLRGTAARCRPGTRGPKRNPWRCTVRYGSGRSVSYSIQVEANGSFRGADREGTRVITGCCVAGGSAPSG